MSTINKKPYIKNLLESLDTDMLNSLSLLIDGEGNQEPIRRTMNLPSGNKTKITEADKGVHLCSLEINYSIFMGYLVYNDDYCCLIWFTDSSSQVIKCFNINLETNAIETVSEELSVLELRSELYDIRGVGSEVVANPTLEGTEPNLEGLEVDGEKYKIPEGTVVEANPTLAGTESPLTGLQVGDTKYAVGGSGKKHLYKLFLTFNTGTYAGAISLLVPSDQDVSSTMNRQNILDFKTYLVNEYSFISFNHQFSCSGYVTSINGEQYFNIAETVNFSSTGMEICYGMMQATINNTTVMFKHYNYKGTISIRNNDIKTQESGNTSSIYKLY